MRKNPLGRVPKDGRLTLGADKGYDTREFVDVLRELDCDLASGFHLARPMDVDELARVIGPMPVS